MRKTKKIWMKSHVIHIKETLQYAWLDPIILVLMYVLKIGKI